MAYLDDRFLRDSITSRIILALLSTGEAYIVDLRSTHRGRFELCDEDEGDERARCVARFASSAPSQMAHVDLRGFLSEIDRLCMTCCAASHM